MKTFALILASGESSRFGKTNKLLEKIGSKSVAQKTLKAFQNSPNIDEIIVVTNIMMKDFFESLGISNIVIGGNTRQESSYKGVFSISENEAKVLIHDCARPFVTDEIINNCIENLDYFDAIGIAVDCSDTIVEVDKNNILKSVPNRQNLKRIQTPQAFKLSVIKKAHKIALETNFNATDDCSLVLNAKLCDVKIIPGSEDNKKITFPDDLAK